MLLFIILVYFYRLFLFIHSLNYSPVFKMCPVVLFCCLQFINNEVIHILEYIFQCRQLSFSKVGFHRLRSIDSFDWISFIGVRAALYIVRCLAISLAFTHEMLNAQSFPLDALSHCDNQKYFHTLLYVS